MTRLLIYICAIVMATAALAGPLERKFIYATDPTHSAPPHGFVEHKMESEDGETIIVWAHKPKPGRATIVYFHGNAGTLANRVTRFNIFTDNGFGVIAMAYRGYSGSTGKPSQNKIVADAEMVLDNIETFGATKIGGIALYGESLGTAVVAQIADTNVPYRAIVLEAPFTSVPDLGEHLLPNLAFATRFLRDTWTSLEAIKTMKNRPLLVMHGSNDTFIPPAMGQAIVDAAPSTTKRFYAVRGATHTTVWQPDAVNVMLAFLRRH